MKDGTQNFKSDWRPFLHIWFTKSIYMYLGKLSYFTNLNRSAINLGMISLTNHDENSEVVVIYPV